MKIYTLKQSQFLPISLADAWGFFSSPTNLAKITPAEMDFKILYSSGGDKAYAGQLIRYHITVMPLVTVQWLTEITHVTEPTMFIDEQRFGPYSLWHHEHRFREVMGGVEMIDELNYAVPFGFIGRIAHQIFVGRKVRAIFEHRKQILAAMFPAITPTNT